MAATITTSTATIECVKPPSYRKEEIEGSYFGGRLKFPTKIIPLHILVMIILNVLLIVGLKVLFDELINLRFGTFLFTFCLHHASGVSITMGSHRLWSHQAFKAKLPIRIILMILQTYTASFSIYTFAVMHKIHHKETDTDGDPHNAKRGFFFAHMGWLLFERHPQVKATARIIDRSNLERDPVVMFQKKYYNILFAVIGLALPLMIPMMLWGESLYVAFMLSFTGRYIIIQQTAGVNSFAHLYGNKPYDKDIMPVDNKWVSIFAYGEGWHNFHHAFPSDYRASEFGYHNVTNTIIEFCAKQGWVYDLKRTSPEMILRKAKRSGDGTRQEH